MSISGSVVTATTLSIGGVSSMNDWSRLGLADNSCDKCQASSGVGSLDRNFPVMSDGLYLYSAHRYWYPNTLSLSGVPVEPVSNVGSDVNNSIFVTACSPICANAGQK